MMQKLSLPLRIVFGITLTAMSFAGHASAGGPAVPAACVSKTVIEPKTPGWAYIVNFESFTPSGAPQGCLVVWQLPRFRPTDYVVSECRAIGATTQITFTNGIGRFSGGYVTCDVNIKQTLAGLPIPVLVPDVEKYKYFTHIGVGAFDDQPGGFAVQPIAYYEPGNNVMPPTGLFAALSANGGVITSIANNITDTGKFIPADQFAIRTVYTIANAYDGESATLTNTHYLSNTVIDTFAPREPVEFWTNGGTFWIGGSPITTSSRLIGRFDEVIFDPPDGGAPPPPARYSLQIRDLFMPLVSSPVTPQ